MSRQNLSAREQRIAVLLGILLICYILQVAVLKPGLGLQKELRQEIAAAEARLHRAEAVLSRAALQDGLAQSLAAARQSGTDEESMSALLSELEQARDGLDLRVSDTKPQRVRREAGLKYFPVQLTVYGQVAEVIQFTHTIQSPPYRLMVNAIQLRAELAAGNGVRCQLTVSRRFVE